MAPITASTEVTRPAEEVFAYVIDPGTMPEWQQGVLRGHMDGAPTRVGSTCTTIRRIGGREREVITKITEYDPPRRWADRGISGPIRAIVAVTVEPLAAGSRSRVTIEVDFTGHGIGRLLVPLVVRRQAAREMPENMRRLKQRLESGHRPAGNDPPPRCRAMTATEKDPTGKLGVGARLLEIGFGRPRGMVGRVGGRLMAWGNAATERRLVEIADLAENDTVLVVGFGPGIGLRAAGERCRHVTGIDPSPVMLAAARRRCAELISRGTVRVTLGTAEDTGLADAAVDVVLSVNNVQLWADRHAGLRELHRVLKPEGRLLLSAHRKWLPDGPSALTSAVRRAGYQDVHSWAWDPAGRGATTAVQLCARRPEPAERATLSPPPPARTT